MQAVIKEEEIKYQGGASKHKVASSKETIAIQMLARFAVSRTGHYASKSYHNGSMIEGVIGHSRETMHHHLML